jgi:hypothetical protein
MKLARALEAVATFALLAMLGACASRGTGQAEPSFAWVQWTGEGHAEVRMVSATAQCPDLQVDGRPLPMHLRAPAATVRAGQVRPAWDVPVCEASVPPGARELRVGEHRLPVPNPQPRRIVVLGDSGCRIAQGVAQACDDPADWPFARVSELAAATRPDLVVHVGDYHYREQPCPAGTQGCAGSPWGYGWEPWRADFFVPAAPLLAAAPWVFVRGNHEECARAGQGWFRLLAPGPFEARRSCDDPSQDAAADYDRPFAVPLGDGLQLLVVDSAVAGNAPLDPRKPRDAQTRARYAQDMRDVAQLAARPGTRSWFLSHHPVLGFAADGPQALFPGNPALQEALRATNGDALFPPSVQLALHGHVHLFEALAFASGEPPTLVAGHGGVKLDEDLSAAALQGASPAPGVSIRAALHSQRFGFVLLERAEKSPDDWTLTAFGVEGAPFATCGLGPGRDFHCTAQAPR